MKKVTYWNLELGKLSPPNGVILAAGQRGVLYILEERYKIGMAGIGWEYYEDSVLKIHTKCSC